MDARRERLDLAPGLTPVQRVQLVASMLELCEYDVRRWPRWWPLRGISMTLPGRIYLADHHWREHEIQRLPVLAHELAHARQQVRVGRWWWMLRYVLDPWFRRREEIIGEAAEAVMRHRLTGLPLVDCVSHRLGLRYLVWQVRDSEVIAVALEMS